MRLKPFCVLSFTLFFWVFPNLFLATWNPVIQVSKCIFLKKVTIATTLLLVLPPAPQHGITGGLQNPRAIASPPPPHKSPWNSSELPLGWSEVTEWEMQCQGPTESQKTSVWLLSLLNTRSFIWQVGDLSETPFFLESPLGLPWKL